MPLGLAVLLVVLAVTAVIAALGYVIDKSAERDERNQGR
jgi:preprotein translocase subunit SecE